MKLYWHQAKIDAINYIENYINFNIFTDIKNKHREVLSGITD
jgi:hypothetical protein